MSGFAVRNPYFIVVVCLIIAVVGVSSLARMPVDMFPTMDIPVVVVATFYSGMPPEQIETGITSRFERFMRWRHSSFLLLKHLARNANTASHSRHCLGKSEGLKIDDVALTFEPAMKIFFNAFYAVCAVYAVYNNFFDFAISRFRER